MHLLHLPAEMKQSLLAGQPEVAGMTIREDIKLAMSRSSDSQRPAQSGA